MVMVMHAVLRIAMGSLFTIAFAEAKIVYVCWAQSYSWYIFKKHFKKRLNLLKSSLNRNRTKLNYRLNWVLCEKCGPSGTSYCWNLIVENAMNPRNPITVLVVCTFVLHIAISFVIMGRIGFKCGWHAHFYLGSVFKSFLCRYFT